ncbi:MAG: hypothetical protein A2X26_13220 [Chloroflexi bacterium GWC2_49_37]|nr:MAG: hypothetical protein A2X26_13220 [Chloroflexi bacterium GWC2_49_37]
MILGQRYDYDGVPIMNLNALQSEMKLQVEKKVSEGHYAFEVIPCAVCGGGSLELLSKKDRYGLYMPVVICKDCGLIQTNPRMTQKAYNEFYNVEYRKLYVGQETPTEDFFRAQYCAGSRIYKFLADSGVLAGRANLSVFEVGCGAGGILQYFRDRGCRVKGIDLGEAYVEYGRNKHGLDISAGTLETVALSDAPDLVIYSHVFEHILSPNAELQKIKNMLTDRGLLYIEIPSVKNLMRDYEVDFLRLLQNAHVYHFTLKSLTNLLSRNGFEILTGNERVCSVFRKIQGGASKDIESDYAAVLNYLSKVEMRRKVFPITFYKIVRWPRVLALNLLEAIGAFNSVRNIYRKIKNVK